MARMWDTQKISTLFTANDARMIVGGENIRAEEFCYISWSIWSARNALIWRNENLSSDQVVQQARRVRRDWVHAQLMKKGSRQEIEVNQAVNGGQQNAVAEWNCSVDAAIFESEGKSGFGFVIRRSGGQFLYAVSGTLPGVITSGGSTVFSFTSTFVVVITGATI
ncbi:hypothetical protein ACFE04_021665 [Oxalis oulophora]